MYRSLVYRKSESVGYRIEIFDDFEASKFDISYRKFRYIIISIFGISKYRKVLDIVSKVPTILKYRNSMNRVQSFDIRIVIISKYDATYIEILNLHVSYRNFRCIVISKFGVSKHGASIYHIERVLLSILRHPRMLYAASCIEIVLI